MSAKDFALSWLFLLLLLLGFLDLEVDGSVFVEFLEVVAVVVVLFCGMWFSNSSSSSVFNISSYGLKTKSSCVSSIIVSPGIGSNSSSSSSTSSSSSFFVVDMNIAKGEEARKEGEDERAVRGREGRRDGEEENAPEGEAAKGLEEGEEERGKAEEVGGDAGHMFIKLAECCAMVGDRAVGKGMFEELEGDGERVEVGGARVDVVEGTGGRGEVGEGWFVLLRVAVSVGGA
jgi:hypothetical protein